VATADAVTNSNGFAKPDAVTVADRIADTESITEAFSEAAYADAHTEGNPNPGTDTLTKGTSDREGDLDRFADSDSRSDACPDSDAGAVPERFGDWHITRAARYTRAKRYSSIPWYRDIADTDRGRRGNFICGNANTHACDNRDAGAVVTKRDYDDKAGDRIAVTKRHRDRRSEARVTD
jgi:hypothetical protein